MQEGARKAWDRRRVNLRSLKIRLPPLVQEKLPDTLGAHVAIWQALMHLRFIMDVSKDISIWIMDD